MLTRRRVQQLGAALILLMLPSPAAAAPISLVLTPGDMISQTHSHAFIDMVTGTFRQFSGQMTFDPVAMTCAIDVTFIVTSLQLPNGLIRAQTMSPGFLDAAVYPKQHYAGVCEGRRVIGNLTMRGQTHRFDMAVTEKLNGTKLTGLHLEGVLNRYVWGLAGLSLTVGKTIRVTDDISLNGQPPRSAVR